MLPPREEVQLWKRTMQKVYGDDWMKQLVSRDADNAAATHEEEDEEEQDSSQAGSPRLAPSPEAAAGVTPQLLSLIHI